ncbi:hypothetical protein P9869_42110 [Streptomyces ossamyceticus]|nr:hypothetical protein [Streptomyces ossamyceticus]
MDATDNKMSGEDWIGESRAALCVRTARHFEDRHREALVAGDPKAEQYKQWGMQYLWGLEHYLTSKPKRIVSDAEAARLRAAEDEQKQAAEDAKHLAALKKKLGIDPRANAGAFHPYQGGLPTLAKHR